MGPNVTLTGIGTINLAALTFFRNGGILIGIFPSFGVVDLGMPDATSQNNCSLGFAPGTCVCTWGSGASADTFTITSVLPGVPEPSTWALLSIGAAGVGFVASRRRLRL